MLDGCSVYDDCKIFRCMLSEFSMFQEEICLHESMQHAKIPCFFHLGSQDSPKRRYLLQAVSYWHSTSHLKKFLFGKICPRKLTQFGTNLPVPSLSPGRVHDTLSCVLRSLSTVIEMQSPQTVLSGSHPLVFPSPRWRWTQLLAWFEVPTEAAINKLEFKFWKCIKAECNSNLIPSDTYVLSRSFD